MCAVNTTLSKTVERGFLKQAPPAIIILLSQHTEYTHNEALVTYIHVSRVSNDMGYCNRLNTFHIYHISTNLRQTVPKESLQTIRSYSDFFKSAKIRIALSLTCVYAYMRPDKCHDLMRGTHKVSALKYTYRIVH